MLARRLETTKRRFRAESDHRGRRSRQQPDSGQVASAPVTLAVHPTRIRRKVHMQRRAFLHTLLYLPLSIECGTLTGCRSLTRSPESTARAYAALTNVPALQA